MLKIKMGLGERDFIEVGLGDRAYPVVVGPGLIARAGELCAPLLTRGRTAVVTRRDRGRACTASA